MPEEHEDMLKLGNKFMVEFSTLNEVKVLLFKEMLKKRHVLNCPRTLQVYNGHEATT